MTSTTGHIPILLPVVDDGWKRRGSHSSWPGIKPESRWTREETSDGGLLAMRDTAFLSGKWGARQVRVDLPSSNIVAPTGGDKLMSSRDPNKQKAATLCEVDATYANGCGGRPTEVVLISCVAASCRIVQFEGGRFPAQPMRNAV